MLKGLAKRKGQTYRAIYGAAEEAGPIAPETKALRREPSMVPHDTPSYRSRVSLEKEAAARRGEVNFGVMPATTLTPLGRGRATTTFGRTVDSGRGDKVEDVGSRLCQQGGCEWSRGKGVDGRLDVVSVISPDRRKRRRSWWGGSRQDGSR